MAKVYSQLVSAQANEKLVDVFLRKTQDIYTGYVEFMATDGFVLNTVNDSGVFDGYVWIKMVAVQDVSVTSPDISTMKKRMEIAENKHLFKGQTANLQAVIPEYSTAKLMDYLIQIHAVTMIVIDDKDRYHEGIITAADDAHLAYQKISSFDFSECYTPERILRNKVEAIEFLGTELHMLTTFFRKKVSHQDPVFINNSPILPDLLKELGKKQQPVLISVSQHVSNFYVGEIKSVSKDSVVMSLYDQVGRFGGYAMIKQGEIASISTNADYVQLVSYFVQQQHEHETYLQPVMDNKMQFDNQNLFADTFDQLIQAKAMVRIRCAGKLSSQLGYILRATNSAVRVCMFDKLPRTKTHEKVITYDKIAEVTWGYLNSYFTRKELLK